MTTTLQNGELQPDLFDVCANRHRGAETSVLAHKQVNKRADYRRILDFLRAAPNGATLDELCVAFDRTPNQLSGRLCEMRIAGWIDKTCEKRAIRSNCLAAVWRIL